MRLLPVALLALAAWLRFPNLAARGTWDADQGHDMRVLVAFVTRGEIPLLGPPTSIGDFHHGALYYNVLAPFALLGGGDPVVVVGAIALAGVLAVGVTWWLASAIGGPIAGAVAGLLMALSATSIEGSTFIWNPNLIALSSSCALAAAWAAWRDHRPAFWLAAGIGATVTAQSHVLGTVLLPPLAVFWLADIRRARPERRRTVLVWGLAGVAAYAVSYVPLVLHELTHDFAETRAALEFVASGGGPAGMDPFSRLLFVTLRLLAWPTSGLILSEGGAIKPAAILAGVVVIALLLWRLAAARGLEREAIAGIALLLGFAALILGLGVGGLATVTPLPTDHYHAFLDPAVFIAIGLGAAAAAAARRPVLRATAAVGVAASVIYNLATIPPPVHPDGGWPAAQAAAAWIRGRAAGAPVALLSLPAFKNGDAYLFPLERDGGPLGEPGQTPVLAVLCDHLFDDLFGPDCGGPAEDGAATSLSSGGPAYELVGRLAAAPGRTISLYGRDGS